MHPAVIPTIERSASGSGIPPMPITAVAEPLHHSEHPTPSTTTPLPEYLLILKYCPCHGIHEKDSPFSYILKENKPIL